MERTRPISVRLVSPWPKHLEFPDGTVVSSEIARQDADGLLCYWAPSPELFSFTGPKLWYNCEPRWSFNQINAGEFAAVASKLPEEVVVNHRVRSVTTNVPHVTHWGALELRDSLKERYQRVVAVVSNNGRGWKQIPNDLLLRNRLATTRLVDLYGSKKAWRGWEKTIFGRPRFPKSYQGEIPNDCGKWHGQAKRSLQSRYRVSLALENGVEANYFTEKFVEAVCAGCVPIYHAHPTVASTYLDGAEWIDPATWNFDAVDTIQAALAADRKAIVAKNRRWATENSYLAATEGSKILERCCNILKTRL